MGFLSLGRKSVPFAPLWLSLVVATVLDCGAVVDAKCYARSRTNVMIKVTTSLADGAQRVDYLYVDSVDACKRMCCRHSSCDMSMFIGPTARVWMKGLVTKNCVLMHCGQPSMCSVSADHEGFTSTSFSRNPQGVSLPGATSKVTRTQSQTPAAPTTTREQEFVTTDDPPISIVSTNNVVVIHTTRKNVNALPPTQEPPSSRVKSAHRTLSRTTSSEPSRTTSSATTAGGVDDSSRSSLPESLRSSDNSSTTNAPKGEKDTVRTETTSSKDPHVVSSCAGNCTDMRMLASNNATTSTGTSQPAGQHQSHFFSSAPALIVALLFALVFTSAILFMVGRRWLYVCQRPYAYQKADYLINGMYT